MEGTILIHTTCTHYQSTPRSGQQDNTVQFPMYTTDGTRKYDGHAIFMFECECKRNVRNENELTLQNSRPTVEDQYKETRYPHSGYFLLDLLRAKILRAHYGAHGRYFRASQFFGLVDKEVRNPIKCTHERT